MSLDNGIQNHSFAGRDFKESQIKKAKDKKNMLVLMAIHLDTFFKG